MELLQERIRREGRVLPGNIVKVDGFLNHRVDTRLLEDIADEFAKYFDTSKITVVLTAEASGIALATICAQKYGVPMLFAKKAKSDNIESGLYQSEVFSYTYKKRVTLLVSQEWLNADDHVLIIDDFMANGEAALGAIRLIEQAGAQVAGVGVVIAKAFQPGLTRLREAGYAPVCVMSGDYVQRGEPAVIPAAARAEAAVRCGAALVLELPPSYALRSAEGFADGGVELLDRLGCAEALCFGSESGDLSALEKTAAVLDTPEFAEALKRELTGGTPFAAARARAARALLGESAAVLDTPNDLLAVEYIRAAAKLGYIFDYTPVRREGSTHDGAGSASELRALLRAGESLAGRVPGEVWEVLRRADEAGHGFVSPESLRTAYLSRLREKTPEDFAAVPDAAEGLHFRLYEAARRGSSPEEIADLAKSKRYAHARLRRMVMCAALGVRAGDANGIPPYIRVLAFDARGAVLLREMKTSAALPVVVKSARVKDENESIQRLFDLGSRAHDLYVLGWKNRALQAADGDYRATPFCSVGNNRNSVHDNQECV